MWQDQIDEERLETAHFLRRCPAMDRTMLRRLAAAMNGREFDAKGGADLAEPMPYSQGFVLAVLNYSHGAATQAQTLAAIGSEDPAALCMYTYQVAEAARKIGVVDAELVRLPERLGVSGTESSATA